MYSFNFQIFTLLKHLSYTAICSKMSNGLTRTFLSSVKISLSKFDDIFLKQPRSISIVTRGIFYGRTSTYKLLRARLGTGSPKFPDGFTEYVF